MSWMDVITRRTTPTTARRPMKSGTNRIHGSQQRRGLIPINSHQTTATVWAATPCQKKIRKSVYPNKRTKRNESYRNHYGHCLLFHTKMCSAVSCRQEDRCCSCRAWVRNLSDSREREVGSSEKSHPCCQVLHPKEPKAKATEPAYPCQPRKLRRPSNAKTQLLWKISWLYVHTFSHRRHFFSLCKEPHLCTNLQRRNSTVQKKYICLRCAGCNQNAKAATPAYERRAFRLDRGHVYEASRQRLILH